MKHMGNMLLVANWESDVGYAWWLMENFWVTIANNLAGKGVKSILIYPKITKIPETIDNTGIRIIEHNFQDTSPKGLIELRKIIKQNHIQHIYLTDSPSYSWLYLLLRGWGIKTIIVHDHTPGERHALFGVKRLVKSITQKTPYFTADYFIAVTEFVYKRMMDVACIPARKCYCASNGIIPIDLNRADLDYAQKIFHIPGDRIIVITTGRATYYKGIDFFIECAHELINKQKQKMFHFLFCGDGPHIEDFKKLVTKYSLDDHFTFAGQRDDVRDILPSCNIGFHTSHGEVGYSLSILEYMSAGLLTIVPNNPSTSLATIENETGYTYEQNNIESAVEAISNYITSNEKNSHSIGEKAAAYIRNEKNITTTNRVLNTIIDKILFK